jgi:hypothetical protein
MNATKETGNEPNAPEAKPISHFQLWMRCLNCGKNNLTYHVKGEPVIWEKKKKVCERCGCDTGWERVDE